MLFRTLVLPLNLGTIKKGAEDEEEEEKKKKKNNYFPLSGIQDRLVMLCSCWSAVYEE